MAAYQAEYMFRFKDSFYGLGTDIKPLKKLLLNGLLGWPLKITVSGITGYDWKFYWSGRTDLTPMPVPENLDYNMWLGPAPYNHTMCNGYMLISGAGSWGYDGGGLGAYGPALILILFSTSLIKTLQVLSMLI